MKTSKKILITGGAGFIGRHLTEYLLSLGHTVTLLDRSAKSELKNVRLIRGDITNPAVVSKSMKGQDSVYHLAGVLGTEELLFDTANAVKINILGAINIMEVAVKNRTKLILISKPNPWLNTYSITKETSEKFAMMYRKEFNLKTVIIKWFSVYGPGQKYGHVQKAVPTFIIRALKNKPLPVFDKGHQTADFIYVSDAAKATVDVSENPQSEGQTVEIGTGTETRIIDLAKLIIKLTGGSSKISYEPMRKGEDHNARVVADTSLLNKLTKFKPLIDLETGLQHTIDYYRSLLRTP